MKTKMITLLAACCMLAADGLAQSLSPFVRPFVKVEADTFALTNAEVIDGTGAPVAHGKTILVENGKIADIGNGGSIHLPAGIKTIDCSGKTIIPGMVMMHEHLFYGEQVGYTSIKNIKTSVNFYVPQEMPISFPMLYLAGGVTTMRTTGDVAPGIDLYLRGQIRAGKMLGPDMDVTAPYIEGPGIQVVGLLRIRNAQQAAREVNYWAAMGCTSVKFYEDLTRAEAKAAIDAAHRHGLKVTGHLSSITYREAAAMGIDNLEHGFYVCSDFDPTKKEDSADDKGRDKSLLLLDKNSPKMKALMAYLIQRKVTVTSTLPVLLPYTGRETFPGGADSALTPPMRTHVRQLWQYEQGKDSVSIVRYKKELFWEKQFVDMGGRLMAGIDPTGAGRVIPGYADRIVPGLLMEAGFTLPQAIKICSLNGAEYLGKEDETGSIAIGKRADLVLIGGDVENNIKNMRKTEIVFKDGTGYDSQKIFAWTKGMVGLH
jgi:imidazolonepropionase-like amidohydrolase